MNTPVPLLDLKAQYQALKPEIDAAVAEVFASQYFIMGPKVAALESACASYCQCKFAVGMSSGTDALLIALMAENIGHGDEVITTPYTFFATAGSIARTGAKPVFVDIDPNTFNINPALIEKAITPRTKAIMPVHLYGQMADMDAIMAIARKHNLVVIEDAAQAIGAEYKGCKAGSIGHYGCYSFFPSKNLGGAGDGGLVTTNDPARAEKLVWLRNHGMNPKYYHKYIGGNFRLDALQAAVLLVKLPHLDAWHAARRNNAAIYRELFDKAGLSQTITLPRYACGSGCKADKLACPCHIFNQFIIRAPKRDGLRDHLTAQKIGCEIYYPVPMHQQECFAHLGYAQGAMPESERAAAETLALPIYPELTRDQLACVVNVIKQFYTL